MSNDKPYTINVEVPTDSIAREETREVNEILLAGLATLFNRISSSLRGDTRIHDNTHIDTNNEDNILEATFEDNSSCDKEDSVIYHDSDQDNM